MIIKLLSHNYDLQVIDDIFNGQWGQSSTKEGWIKISNKTSTDVQFSTLIHEIVHIISDQLDLGLKTDEIKISALALGIYSFIKDNPEILTAIKNGGKL